MDAYIPVNCIVNSERTRVGDFLTKTMDDVGNNNPVDASQVDAIFDEILLLLEAELAANVLHGFMESRFYNEFQSKYMLNDALIPVTNTSV